jgi:hypothetical protein
MPPRRDHSPTHRISQYKRTLVFVVPGIPTIARPTSLATFSQEILHLAGAKELLSSANRKRFFLPFTNIKSFYFSRPFFALDRLVTCPQDRLCSSAFVRNAGKSHKNPEVLNAGSTDCPLDRSFGRAVRIRNKNLNDESVGRSLPLR